MTNRRNHHELIKQKLQEQVNNLRSRAVLDALYPRVDKKGSTNLSLLRSSSVPAIHTILDEQVTNKPLLRTASVLDNPLAKQHVAKQESACEEPPLMQQYFGSIEKVDCEALEQKLDAEGRLFPTDEEFYLYHSDSLNDINDVEERPVQKERSSSVPAEKTENTELRARTARELKNSLLASLDECLDEEMIRWLPEKKETEQEDLSTNKLIPGVAQEIYGSMCKKLGVVALRPAPAFYENFGLEASISSTSHAYALAAALRSFPAKSIFLKNNYMSDDGASRVIKLCAHSHQLTKLHIENSPLGPMSCHEIMDKFKDSWTLSDLCLVGTGLGSDDLLVHNCGSDIPSYWEAAEQIPIPEYSSPCEEEILEEQRKQAATASSSELPPILEADLQQGNEAEKIEVEVSANPQEDEPPVQKLRCPMLLPVFSMLRSCQTIKILDLSHNLLQDKSWFLLTETLEYTVLQELRLNYCYGVDRHAAALADGLKVNDKLRDLQLRGNEYRNTDTAALLCSALSSHSSLLHLDFAEIPWQSPNVAQHLCALMDQSPSLVCFHLLYSDRPVGIRPMIFKHFEFREEKQFENCTDEDELVMWRALHVKRYKNWAHHTTSASRTTKDEDFELNTGEISITIDEKTGAKSVRKSKKSARAKIEQTENDEHKESTEIDDFEERSTLPATQKFQGTRTFGNTTSNSKCDTGKWTFTPKPKIFGVVIPSRSSQTCPLPKIDHSQPLPCTTAKSTKSMAKRERTSVSGSPRRSLSHLTKKEEKKNVVSLGHETAVFKSGCWICNKCSVHSFRWTNPGSGDVHFEQCPTIVCSFRDNDEVPLQKKSTTSKSAVYAADLFVPPGDHFYAFKFIGKPLIPALDLPIYDIGRDLLNPRGWPGGRSARDLAVRVQQTVFDAINRGEEAPLGIKVNKISKKPADMGSVTEGGTSYEENMTVLLGKKAGQAEFEYSKRMRQCFEDDWSQINRPEVCPRNQEEGLRDTIIERYPDVYAIFCVFAGSSAWPCIKQIDIFDVFEALDLLTVDKNSLATVGENSLERRNGQPSLTWTDAQMIILQCVVPRKNLEDSMAIGDDEGTTTAGKMLRRRRVELERKEMESQPINRATFLELLIRIGIALYGGTCKDSEGIVQIADSFTKLVEMRLMPNIVKPPLLPFPRQIMWSVEVSNLLFENTTMLHQVHHKYCKSIDFMDLAQKLRLMDKTFTAKHVRSVFCLSKTSAIHGKLKDKKFDDSQYDTVCEKSFV